MALPDYFLPGVESVEGEDAMVIQNHEPGRVKKESMDVDFGLKRGSISQTMPKGSYSSMYQVCLLYIIVLSYLTCIKNTQRSSVNIINDFFLGLWHDEYQRIRSFFSYDELV